MTYEEAVAWLNGERSWTNAIPQHPIETWTVRAAEADAAAVQEAYWVYRAHTEFPGLKTDFMLLGERRKDKAE